jgi:hypothetical protein
MRTRSAMCDRWATGRRWAAGALMALAVMGASRAAGAEVSVNINVGPPPPVYVLAAPPPLVVVPGSPVYYAPAVSFNYFVYGGRYYTFHDGAWFAARGYNGPWAFVAPAHVPAPVLAVPVAYYKVPPGHLKRVGPPPGAGHAKGPKLKD